MSLGEMFAEAYSLKPKVDSLLSSLQTALDEILLVLDREKLQEPLHRSVANLAQTSTELREVLTDAKPKLTGTLDQVASLSRDMQELVRENRAAVRDNLAALARITAQLDTVANAMSGVAVQLENRQGTLAHLLYEDDLYKRLQASVSGVDSLTIELRQQLGKYLGGADIKLLNLIDF